MIENRKNSAQNSMLKTENGMKESNGNRLNNSNAMGSSVTVGRSMRGRGGNDENVNVNKSENRGGKALSQDASSSNNRRSVTPETSTRATREVTSSGWTGTTNLPAPYNKAKLVRPFDSQSTAATGERTSRPVRGRSTNAVPTNAAAASIPSSSSGNLTFHTVSQPSARAGATSRERPGRSTPNAPSPSSHTRKGRSTSPSRGILSRIVRSRSRSWGRRSKNTSHEKSEAQPLLVAVTSCRSDAYHYQKAPGATSRLPRKAPSALKLFHELAVGVKDAYEAVGAVPVKPEHKKEDDRDGSWVLFEFMGNLDFLLALVDEVAVDTVTRGALKDDTAFKCLRDVIKKSNKILDSMLIRRERKYTLFFRLVQPNMHKELAAIQKWNNKVERAVKSISELKTSNSRSAQSDTESDVESLSATSASTQNSSVSGKSSTHLMSSHQKSSGSVFSRGRSMFPSAGRVRGRRSTPTPRLRDLHIFGGPNNKEKSAAEDGFSTVTAPNTNISLLQQQQQSQNAQNENGSIVPLQFNNLVDTLNLNNKPIQAKDELVDIIRGIRNEKNARGGVLGSSPDQLKPNWQPKADIPSAVPKLPVEYIHRHRLMKHVVNSLLDRPGMGTREAAKDVSSTLITSVTSRHADKAGNGKTILAVAAIQTVEVRERFCDGILWIKLGRNPLTEMDVRYLYGEIYRQITVIRSGGMEEDVGEEDEEDFVDAGVAEAAGVTIAGEEEEGDPSPNNPNTNAAAKMRSFHHFLMKSRRKFQNGELEGMKEDLATYLCQKKILLCIDDVWTADDLDWFLFQKTSSGGLLHPNQEEEEGSLFRILISTRQPGLLCGPNVHEVFVRIFSEHEAVKLLLASAGKRPYGNKTSPVFSDARVIVKGCGNSPLAIRLAGGMLMRQRSFTLRSLPWISLVEQCRTSLEEATRLRSFSKAVGQIVDLSFDTVPEHDFCAGLRRCFVSFGVVFHNNDWLKIGKGIPKNVVLRLFGTVTGLSRENSAHGEDNDVASPALLLKTLETMHLIERARPCRKRERNGASSPSSPASDDVPPVDTSTATAEGLHGEPFFVMHDSIIAIAEEMSKRPTPSFSTPEDTTDAPIPEPNTELPPNSPPSWSNALRNAAKYLGSITNRDEHSTKMEESQFHELLVASLTDRDGSSRITAVIHKQKDKTQPSADEYLVTFLPLHLIRSKEFVSAGELLVDKYFIARRVARLGCVVATRRHVLDLAELRRELLRENGDRTVGTSSEEPPVPESPTMAGIRDETPPDKKKEDSPSTRDREEGRDKLKDMNINNILRDGSRRIIDEVYRVDTHKSSQPAGSGGSLSLNMAICLSFIGEGLLRCRQPRDAMLRLEEAVGIYRGILGPYHIDVARALFCAAKAYVKIGEHRVALLKFGEAGKIYDACNSACHHDALANSQNMASLFFELGDFNKAESKYEELIALRRSLPGGITYELARTLNDYAAVLAKHGKVDEALARYEEARFVFQGVAASSLSPSEALLIDSCYDIVMLDLNIASIKAKKGDLPGAIEAYENVVRVLQKSETDGEKSGITRDATLAKHLLVAMGRIGSLKLKQGDNKGALKAYEEILNELTDSSPTFVQIEVARSHIKCAMIFRQDSSTEMAIDHLSKALSMYMQLYGAAHRDTQALQSSLRKWQQECQREASPEQQNAGDGAVIGNTNSNRDTS